MTKIFLIHIENSKRKKTKSLEYNFINFILIVFYKFKLIIDT